MLVISRNIGEKVVIGEGENAVTVQVVDHGGGQVNLQSAPRGTC